MLAAYYTIQREMFGEEKEDEHPAYSFAPAPNRNIIEIDGDSEFARAVDGKNQNEVLPVLDELMTTLTIVQPKLYSAVMDKLA